MVIIPNHWGSTHNDSVSQEHPPPVWNAGTQDSLICLLDQELVVMTTRACLLGCWGSFYFHGEHFQFLVRQGCPYLKCPHSQTLMCEPHRGRTMFPEDPPDPPRLRWQGQEQGETVPLRTAPLWSLGLFRFCLQGLALFFSTSCSQSWRCRSLLSPRLLCGRCLRIKNHSLDRAGCASPEDSPLL